MYDSLRRFRTVEEKHEGGGGGEIRKIGVMISSNQSADETYVELELILVVLIPNSFINPVSAGLFHFLRLGGGGKVGFTPCRKQCYC